LRPIGPMTPSKGSKRRCCEGNSMVLIVSRSVKANSLEQVSET
jgi:hypothetical protein